VSTPYFTSRVEHRGHDGGHPGGLAVGGVELVLQVGVEDAHAGGEGQGQRQDHDGGGQHHPAPPAVRSLDRASRLRASAFELPVGGGGLSNLLRGIARPSGSIRPSHSLLRGSGEEALGVS